MGSKEGSENTTQRDHSVPWRFFVTTGSPTYSNTKETCKPFASIWCYEENDPKMDFDFRISDFHKNPTHTWGVCFSCLSDEETEAQKDEHQL